MALIEAYLTIKGKRVGRKVENFRRTFISQMKEIQQKKKEAHLQRISKRNQGSREKVKYRMNLETATLK